MQRSASVAAALAVSLAAGCGGDPAQTREVAELRSRTESQAAQVVALEKRLADLEARDRVLEERLTAAAMTRPAGAKAAAPGAAPAAGDDVQPAATDEPVTPAAESVLLALDSARVQARIGDLIEQERKRRDDDERRRRMDDIRVRVHERIYGETGDAIGLTEQQKAIVENIFVDSMERIGEVWRRARESGRDGGSQGAMEEMQRVRTEAEDQLRSALSVEQFDKLQEQAGRIMGFGGGGGGRGFGGPGGGGAGGGGPGRGR